MRKTPAWQDLDIQFVHDAKTDVKDKWWRDSKKDILAPFQYFRGLRHVKITGMTPKILGGKIAAKIMSTNPVPDLEVMFDEVKEYVKDLGHWECRDWTGEYVDNERDQEMEPLIHDLVESLEGCRNTFKIQQFKRDRNRLMRLATSMLLKRQAHLLQHDPTDWNVPYSIRSSKGPGRQKSQLTPPDPRDASELAEYERRTFYHNDSA